MSCAPETRRLASQSVMWTVGIGATVAVTALAIYGVVKGFRVRYERALAAVSPEKIAMFETQRDLRGIVYELREAWRFGRGRVHPNFEAFWSAVEANGGYYGKLVDHASAVGKSAADVKGWVSLPVLRPWPTELWAMDPRPMSGGYVVGAIFSSLGIVAVSATGVTVAACVAANRAEED